MRQSLRISQYIFQSTLSVRRATSLVAKHIRHLQISIHALREESDTTWPQNATHPIYFNPRSP